MAVDGRNAARSKQGRVDRAARYEVALLEALDLFDRKVDGRSLTDAERKDYERLRRIGEGRAA